jgi:endonuclease YncB( thermonuclease family)
MRHDDFQRPSVPYYHYPFLDPDSVANTLPDSREQFTTVIPSCYDGDTCYTTDLSFNGQPLPDMFASMKIRLNGIDAPELSRANCELERCLARHAKHEIERIVESGGGNVLALQQCKPDKYGGRMVCDILTRKGKVASELMLEKGLAVRYSGLKKKEFSWCQHRKGPKELKSRIDECLSEICPWHKSGSTSDCQDAFIE